MRPTIVLLLLAAAFCIAPTAGHAAPKTFGYYYFLGTINPKSWDGPYWWGLRTDIAGLVVSRVEAREVRSDRAGYAALGLTFTLLNTGTETVGRSALILSASEPQPYYPWWPDRSRIEVLEPEPDPWIVSSELRAPTLARGASIEVSTVVYRNLESDRTSGATAPAISLQVSAE